MAVFKKDTHLLATNFLSREKRLEWEELLKDIFIQYTSTLIEYFTMIIVPSQLNLITCNWKYMWKHSS